VSITTKKGDQGMTGLMYNRQVPKSHPRVEAYGAVDELQAALGVARATVEHPFVREKLLHIQQDLVVLMGELATLSEDMPRYLKSGFSTVSGEMTAKLDQLIIAIEQQNGPFRDWAIPGVDLGSAALHLARTICRRAERRVCVLRESNELQNAEIAVYLNRLSDALWLLARVIEMRFEKQSDGPLLA
jgi:cob(I)alamin adenosyltransferase